MIAHPGLVEMEEPVLMTSTLTVVTVLMVIQAMLVKQVSYCFKHHSLLPYFIVISGVVVSSGQIAEVN